MRVWLILSVAAVLARPGAAHADDPPDETVKVPVEIDDAGGFSVGSYGRVSIGTDLRGGTPEPISVVGHGPRIVEPSYLELDLYYDQPALADIDVRTVATIAFMDELAHFSGDFEPTIALRNLYAEAVIKRAVGLWVGSRMYRGDDIYLLDFWPLDDYNTVGGGGWWKDGPWDIRAHIGANRLRDPFQFQEIEVPDPEFGSTTIEQLDRQRFVATATPAYVGPWFKVKLHFDIQALGDGELRRDDNSIELLPDDFGFTAGGQVGVWDFGPGGDGPRGSFANMFVKYSQGLSAFDELDVPEGLDADKRAFPGAKELLFGLAGNYEFPHGGVQVGGYSRRFVDADPNEEDLDDGWEHVIDLRPYGYLFDGALQGAIDVSYQKRYPRGFNPTLGNRVVNPSIFQIAPMVMFSPRGAGAYTRPHLRLVFSSARLDNGARDQFATEDPRRNHRWVYFLGLQAEWWFNSSTYE